jgi:nuclear pore complex protein Nup188
LPGGEIIPAGTLGDVDEEVDAAKRRVSLQVSWNAWPVLFELLSTIAGVPGAGAKGPGGDEIAISVADLGVEADRQEALAAGLILFKAVLHPTFKLDQPLFDTLSTGTRIPVVALSELVIRNLHRLRDSDDAVFDSEIILSSLEILSHLLHYPQSEAWTILRNSNFFTSSSSLSAAAAGLLRKDAERDTHAVTFALVRLVDSISAKLSDTTPADPLLVRSGLQLITSSVFVSAIGWRFADPIDRYELFGRMLSSYLSVLRNPYLAGGTIFTEPAAYLTRALITSTSSHIYRPIVDIISQGMVSAGENGNSYVQQALNSSIDLVTTLLRIASSLEIPANSLPLGLFSASVSALQSDGRVEKLSFTDQLFRLAVTAGVPAATRIKALTLIRCYVLSTSTGANRSSLASVVRDIHDTTSALEKSLDTETSVEIKTLIWSLLGTVVSAQPICASACTGPSDSIGGILGKAVNLVVDAGLAVEKQPRFLASLLAYLLAVVNSPTSTSLIPLLRAHATFWPAIFELSRSIVPAPPSFMLSMHAEDFASRIEKYAYGVQAKANATLLLAAELNALAEDEDEHTKSKARDLVLGLFKNGDDLAEVIGTAGHNGCYPSEHEKYRSTLKKLGVDVSAQKSLALHAERAYGLTYIYGGSKRVQAGQVLTADGQPALRNNAIGQSSVNLALDVLNLSWSIVDAEIAYTNAIGRLSSAVLVWTEDDQLVTRPAIRSAVNLAEMIGEEPREGDIILAIQAERMEILAALVDMALGDDVEIEKGRLVDLWRCIRRILETGIVSDSLRHPNLPPLHKPMLRMLPLMLGATARSGVSQADVESPIAAATDFALDASDIVLNALIHQTDVPPEVAVDLSSIVGVLGEVVRIADSRSWVDKIAQHGMISRSLEIVTRATLTNGHVPPQVASVMLLHLSLASQPAFAERLALSGILPAYANNVIAVEGSSGSISSDMNNNNANSVHSIWCGMLMVVNALLSTLAPRPASNFAQSEVFPFIGAYHQQIFRALAWDKDASLTTPALNQLDLVTTLFLGLAQALGPNETLMYEICAPLLSLLSAITYELNHPNDLSRRFVASTEEERAELETELERLDAQSPVLFDFVKTPILAQRAARVMAIARNVVVTLVILTNGWGTLADVWHGNVSGEHVDGTALESWVSHAAAECGALVAYMQEDHESSVDEPISVLTDLFAQSKAALTHIPLSIADASAIAHRSTINQLAESSMVLVAAQIVYRYSLLPPEVGGEDDKMDVDLTDKKSGAGTDGSTGGSGDEKVRDAGANTRLSLGSGASSSERNGDDERRKRLVEAAAEAVRQLPEYEDGDRFLLKLREVLEAIPGVYVAE